MLAALLGGAVSASSAATVTVASVDRLEQVATDASTGALSTIPNLWGGHQPRITRHADGTVRILYITVDSTAMLTWHLMRRTPAGVWGQEASGPSTDDVGLLRDPRDDRAYVMAWPGSVPTAYAGPTYNSAKVPGSWQILPSKYRQYGNVGIGPDGTVCLKASREINVLPVTSQDKTEYACGKYDAATKLWTWRAQVSSYIGLRHTYDYLFPNPRGLDQGLYGTAQRDLHKSASNVPLLDPARPPYVYDGARTYSGKFGVLPTSPDTFAQFDHIQPIPAPVGATAAPMAKLTDAYMDSKNRIFSSHHKEDPLDSTVYGTYLTVSSPSGQVLYSAKWAGLEIYGATRIFEDAKGRLWLLWSNRGSRTSEIRVYPIIETTSPTLKFTLGPYFDLSKQLGTYALDGTIFIAAPRGGNAPSLYVDAIMNACTAQYVPPNVIGSCYNADGSGLQRVVYLRIRLPD
ncbi:hypothetical protein D0T25_24965 [Duganella sp. BJB488]|nr:hypothetical protein D0T26_24190 [Duganella sp. BJB489]RFP16516.1 hypothetical protein D0T25_24965 [Duganella sp. BJB488]RFP30754.1 hypothetical protein D0T24_25535 [Duganella sp. BJB480]